MAKSKNENQPIAQTTTLSSPTEPNSVIFIDLLIISMLKNNDLIEDLLSIPFDVNRDGKQRVQTLLSLQAERLRVFHIDGCAGLKEDCVPTCQSNGSTVCCVNSFSKDSAELVRTDLRYDNKDINFKLPKIIVWGDCLVRAYKSTAKENPVSVTSNPLNSKTPTNEDLYLVEFSDQIKLVEIIYKGKSYEIEY